MSTDPTRRTSEAEVRAFAEKLASWAEGLPPHEQAFLLTLVARATGNPGDTHGFLMRANPEISPRGTGSTEGVPSGGGSVPTIREQLIHHVWQVMTFGGLFEP